LFNLAEDVYYSHARLALGLLRPSNARPVSKIATPVSAVEGHTVFCTPNTDDRIGGIPDFRRQIWNTSPSIV
jgi:hypothetical protein